MTGEKADGTLTRYGLEEYVADCVILLDHRIEQQISTRRLRVIKYRGSSHGTDEYPFLIGRSGISVLPITSAGLDHEVSSERISTGLTEFDCMLGNKGFYRGSSILVSGTAGSGKSMLAMHIVNAACKREEKCLAFAFEESPDQLIRNMRSVQIDLKPHVESGRLHIHASRPTIHGLELHLVTMHDLIRELKPQVVVIDPISDFTGSGSYQEIKAMLTRLIDFIKTQKITGLFTSLACGESMDASEQKVSSLMDTWIVLRDIERDGDCHRGLRILKSRGMKHSNQIREFFITDEGIEIQPNKGKVSVGRGQFSADHCSENTP